MGSSIIQVDDQLPCVAEQKRADGSHLAFSRAKAESSMLGPGGVMFKEEESGCYTK